MKRILSLVLVLALAGCATTPNQTAYQTTAITVATVNAFESAYGTLYRNNLVSADAQAKVHAAVDSYNAALALEQALVTASSTNSVTATTAAVATAEQSIIAAISPLLTPAQVQSLLLVQ